MRRRWGLIGVAVLLLAACPSEHDPYTAMARGQARDEVAAAEDFHAETQRQIAEAEAAAAEAARVIAEQQAQAEAEAQRQAAAVAAAARSSRSATTARPRPAAVTGGDVWAALARCESGGNPRAVGGGGRYFGAFQFSLGTWRSVGGTGNPVDHPYEVQLGFAQRLQARSGWGQWPKCSRQLGLR